MPSAFPFASSTPEAPSTPLSAADSAETSLVVSSPGEGEATIDSLRIFNFLPPCSEIRFNSATKDRPQNALWVNSPVSEMPSITNRCASHLVYFVTYLSSLLKLMRRCSSLMVTASCRAPASSSVFQGFTMMLPLRLCAAPVNSDKMRTPCRFF